MSTPDSRTPRLEELLRTFGQWLLDDLHTGFPGKVVSYDRATQQATILPLVQRPIDNDDGSEDIEEFPSIPNVPIMFPRTRRFSITFPLLPDDIVWVCIAERSIDKFLSSTGKTTVDPDDFRTFDISDAVAYPGGYPPTVPVQDTSEDAMVIGRDGGGLQIHIGESGLDIKLGGKATKHVVLAEDLRDWYENDLKPWLADHSHPSSGSQPSLPGPPGFDSGIISNVVAIPENK